MVIQFCPDNLDNNVINARIMAPIYVDGNSVLAGCTAEEQARFGQYFTSRTLV